MMSGIIPHDLTQYPVASRSLVSQAFSLHAGFGVLQIVPGSAADRAGLKIDDEILAVGNASVEDQAAVDGARQSYSREDQFASTLSAALAKGPAPLLVRRGWAAGEKAARRCCPEPYPVGPPTNPTSR